MKLTFRGFFLPWISIWGIIGTLFSNAPPILKAIFYGLFGLFISVGLGELYRINHPKK